MQCPVCYKEHPKTDYPWRRYQEHVYWNLPDDGAPIKCGDCNEDKEMRDVYLTQLTCGTRRVICKDCIDEQWMENHAKNLGTFPD